MILRSPAPTVCKCNWPRVGARPIDFIASLQTDRLCLQRLLWSRQIEQSNARTQSGAVGRRATLNDRLNPPSKTVAAFQEVVASEPTETVTIL